MSQTQQEAYHVFFKNTPQKVYQVLRMLSMLKQATKAKEQKKLDQSLRKNDWEKFSRLRKELDLPITPEMKVKFNNLPRQQRLELIKDCEQKVLVQAGEKDYEFLIANNKMLAEPQILDKTINLEQLKKMLVEYGLQFHIKELDDKTKELHFFAKDSNIAAHAIDRTIEQIINDPETITKPTLEQLIEKAKAQTKEKKEKLSKENEFKQNKPGIEAKTNNNEELAEMFESMGLLEDVKEELEL